MITDAKNHRTLYSQKLYIRKNTLTNNSKKALYLQMQTLHECNRASLFLKFHIK